MSSIKLAEPLLLYMYIIWALMLGCLWLIYNDLLTKIIHAVIVDVGSPATESFEKSFKVLGNNLRVVYVHWVLLVYVF